MIRKIKEQPSGHEKIERAIKIVEKLRATGVKLHTYDLRHPFSSDVQPNTRSINTFKVNRKKI